MPMGAGHGGQAHSNNFNKVGLDVTRGNESFDMEFMMPPDIMSIDSDISK
jgi:hypothetical protein